MKLTARQIAVVALAVAATMPLMCGARSDSDAPIGVFDSGLGGLTVLERLLDVDQANNATGMYGPDGVPDLAHESFTYLGDQANMPYGDYAAEGKSDYLRELILKDAKFLLATNYYRHDKEVTPGGTKKRAKIIVIACNTATAWGLDDVRKYLASVGDGTKVVGVIEAGVRATLDHVGAKADSRPFAVGVMATPGTIASGAYERTIRAELKARGVACDVPVVNQGCAGLADAVESGSPAADSIARSNLVSLVEQYRASGKSAPIKAVILGCTHYPFVLGTLEKTVAELRAKGAPFAADFRFVDPAFYTAAECHRVLRESGRLANTKGMQKVDAFLSVANPALPRECLTSDGQLTRAFKYGRDVGSEAVTTKPVPFTRDRFGEDVFRNIGRLLPRTAAMLNPKDFGDFYTRAWYLVVDNPGPAKSLSWRIFNVCGPMEYQNDVEKDKSVTIRRETAVRRVDTPWMEVSFHTNRPISVIRIRPSRKPGEEFDLYGARIFLLDKNRKIVWHHRIWNTDGQVDYDAGIEFSDRDMLGQTLPERRIVGNRVSAPIPPPPADMRLHLAKCLFNPEAMARAINAYAAKYPSLFPDKDALLAEIDAAKTDAAAADRLSRKVFLRLPAFRRFSDFLAIRRGDGNAMGLPQNWQGNTSVPVSGYSNALVRVSLAKDGSTSARTLHESDSFIGDVALDWNLEKVAFSTRKLAEAATGRRAPSNGAHGGIGESGWCVAEMGLAAPGRLREITPTDTPDIDYYDPMYLPDGKMLLMGTVGFQGVPCVGGADHVGNLMLRNVDGRLRRLSFDQDNNWHPVMLPNGRCLYLRWEYTDSAHYFARILMTMNPDGSDQQEFYGSNSYWPNALFYAKPIPGSSTRFMAVVTGHHGVSRKGELVLFDVAKGRRETSGAVQKLPGWGKPVENVTADRLVNDARQFFLHPYPLSDEGALVAMQDYAFAKHFFIAYVDVFDNQYPLLVSEDDSANYLEPLPIEKREKPFEVAQRVDESQKTARVNIVSVYDGPGLAGIPKGIVKKLRLFNYEYCSYRNHGKSCGGHYCIGMEGPWDVRVMLGEVDVEDDGSVLFECPANVPIVIQPLDAEGKHLQEMRSWFAAMPGETLSCLGCHQDQNAAPPSGTRTRASLKPPQKIRPWYGPRRGFAFERETLNVIERRCSGCHDGSPAKKNVIGQPLPNFAGSPREVYDALHPYVRRNGPEGDYHLLTPGEFHADTSELWQRLVLGHHGVRLSKEEGDRILAWMNMNVPFFGTWTETGKPDPEIVKRRRQLARQVANDDFDPEKVVNPYSKAAFEKPAASAAATDRLAAKFDPLAGVGPGAPAPAAGEVLDLGNGATISLKPIPGSSAFGPFLLAETEITVAQYRAFDPSFDNGVYDMHYKDQVKRGYYMNDDPVFGTPGAVNFPAVRISHEKAEAFCRWLSRKTGREVRLPTEAEWHWAARAGAGTPFFWGGMDADFGAFANLADVTRRELAVNGINPKPIPNPAAHLDWELKDARFDDGVLHLAKAGSYRANAWGLKDMVGNAAEWTSSDATFTDGVARKVVCGGSFNDRPHRALMRWGYPAWMRPFDVGFRIAVSCPVRLRRP